MWLIGLISLLILTAGLIYALIQLRQNYNSRLVKLTALRKVLEQENAGYAKELKRLTSENSWYRSLFRATEEMVFAFEIDADSTPGTLIEVNDLACHILGYTREEMLKMSPLDIQAGQDAIPSMGIRSSEGQTESEGKPSKGKFFTRETRVLMERILEKDELVYSGSYACQDDKRIPVEINARCLNLDERNIVLLSAHDITVREAARDALNESEQRFLNFFNQSPIGVAIYDTNHQLKDVNPACLRIFGCPTKEEFANLDMFDNPFIPANAQKAISNGESAHFEADFDFAEVRRLAMFVSSRSGHCHYDILITSLGHDTNFKTKGYTAQVQDITERKNTELALHRSEKMLRQAEKMEAIGSMAGGIAHDFNNILTPLLGYAEIALRSVETESAMANYVEEILKASHRAKDLVDQILAFSRKNDKEGQPIHLIPIVKEVLKLVQAPMPEHIKIERIIKTERDIVKADPTQIHQVLMNLCTNAWHAMREQPEGTLEVRVTDFLLDHHYKTEFPTLETGRHLRVSVKDTGTGIDKQTMNKIFDPFFTTKGKGEGTGLGLAVVHSIVASCKGRVTVESAPNEGTTFNVILPLLDDNAETVIADSVAPLPTGTETVLIVDDEQEIVEMIATMLGSLGYHPVFARDGSEALEKFNSSPQRFDAVVADQIMPGMSGSQLSLELMMVKPGLPIILCTGHSESLSQEELHALGISRILKKPIVMKDLAAAMREVLDGKTEVE